MKTNRTTRRLTVAALCVLPAALIGCKSAGTHHAGDIESIRSDPTPALHSLAERSSDRWNHHARMRDQNIRALNNDIDRMFYIDRPSRLHQGVKP